MSDWIIPLLSIAGYLGGVGLAYNILDYFSPDNINTPLAVFWPLMLPIALGALLANVIIRIYRWVGERR